MLKPIINKKTDILFIPLNPSEESSKQGHYFAANEVFWNSLKLSNLIKANLTKIGFINLKNKNSFIIKIENQFADLVVFKQSKKNYRGLVFSINDLASDIICSVSQKVNISYQHIQNTLKVLKDLNPKFAIIMHRKVRDDFIFKLRKDLINKFREKEFEKWADKRNEFNKINSHLNPDWGPFGKVITGLNTSFFCIPFPSTQNGSFEQNISYWKKFKEFIDSGE